MIAGFAVHGEVQRLIYHDFALYLCNEAETDCLLSRHAGEEKPSDKHLGGAGL
jgi:hypothetical protein